MSVDEIPHHPDVGEHRSGVGVAELPRSNERGNRSGGADRGRPGTSWYAAALVLPAVATALAIAYWALSSQALSDTVDGFHRFPPPDEITEPFDEGRVHIYAEPSQAASDAATETQSLPQVEVFAPDGSRVSLVPYLTLPGTDRGWTYETAGHQGVGVTSFSVDEPGEYRIVATGGQGLVLAVGDGVGQAREKFTFNAFGYALLGFAAGGVVAGVIAMLRRRPGA